MFIIIDINMFIIIEFFLFGLEREKMLSIAATERSEVRGDTLHFFERPQKKPPHLVKENLGMTPGRRGILYACDTIF